MKSADALLKDFCSYNVTACMPKSVSLIFLLCIDAFELPLVQANQRLPIPSAPQGPYEFGPTLMQVCNVRVRACRRMGPRG